MSEDKRFQLMKTYKERQDKFIYYITGINVAAIGFTLSKTFDIVLKEKYDLILFAAVFCWVISTLASLRWIYIQTRIMEMNLDVYDLRHGYFDKSKISEIIKIERITQCKLQLTRDISKCVKAINATILFFVFGMLAFVLWRVVDMV